MTESWGHMTLKQLQEMTPLEAMAMIQGVALKARQLGLSMAVTQAAAPYKHARLASRIIDEDTGDAEIVVTGGFPVD